jgi:flagellar hook-associated protein 2
MPIRLSGMSSGLDTEALVSALVSGYRTQKDNLVKAQTKLQWKQDKWNTMNTKIYSFYTGSLSTSRFSKNYNLKKAKISNSNYASVDASTSAVTGTQSLKVKKLATAGYLTGGVISADSSKTDSTKIKGDTKLSEISGMGSGSTGKLEVTAEGKTTSIQLSDDMTVNNLIIQLKSAGVNASFDETNQRFFISSKTSGTEHEFSLTASDANGKTALSALGLADTSIDNIDNIIAPYKSIVNNTSYVEDTVKNRYNSDVSSFNSNVGTYLSNIKSATASLKVNNYKSEYIKDFMDTAGEDGSGIVKARENLSNAMSDLENDLKNDTLSEAAKAEKQARLQAVKGIISLADDTSTYDTAKKLQESNATEIKSLNSTIDSNTDSITAMYKEAGFGDGADSTYSIDAANGKLIIKEDSDMAKYVGTDGKIDTEKYTYDMAEAATSSDASSKINSYKTEAQEHLDYADKMVKAYETVKSATTDSDKTTAEYKAALNTLGVSSDTSGSSAKRIYAQDSEIELNGATFTNNTNTFSINGLTITATALTGDNEVTISTENDVDGIYDSIKSFISDYNSLIKEIDTAYNAASAKGYEPLTSDEKSAMTDDQVKEWEDKIKTSLLRRDGTLSSISNMMKTDMLRSFNINGKAYSLSSFGISTAGYFSSGDNEKGVLHIDGDSDDSTSASNEDKLKAAIASDPDTVISFFSQLADNLYTDLGKKMQGTTMRSTFKVYNDKEMAKEYSDYTTKIKDKETEISTWEDYYYNKFSKMESALASLNSQQSSLSGYFG